MPLAAINGVDIEAAVERESGVPAMIGVIEVGADAVQRADLPERVVREMYDLLGSNMTRALGGADPDWRSDSRYAKWRDDVFLGAVQERTRHILLLDETGLRGFLSYSAEPEARELYVNELQIRPSCQGDGVSLRRLLRVFAMRIGALPQNALATYSNRANSRAHRLAAKMGFHVVGETPRGYRYQMPTRDFVARFTRGATRTAARDTAESRTRRSASLQP